MCLSSHWSGMEAIREGEMMSSMSLMLSEELEVVSAMLPLVFAVLIASSLTFNGELVFCELLF